MNISTKDKRILIVSDPHQNMGKLRHILKAEDYDQAVVLGDWFDSFYYDKVKDVKDTCETIKEYIVKPDFITLLGNHDAHYLYDNRYCMSSGFNGTKSKLIRSQFGSDFNSIRQKFEWYTWVDKWLCSHAGIHRYHFPPNQKLSKKALTIWLDDQANFARNNLFMGAKHWFYVAGKGRGGPNMYGGIIWLDFNCEFEAIPEVEQIVGHTQGHKVVSKFLPDNPSTPHDICIDSELNEYLIIDNGMIEILKYSDL